MPTTLRRPVPRPLALAVLCLGGVAFAQPPQPVAVLKGHTDTVYAVAVGPDGKLAATGSFDKTIKLWDPATGKEVRPLGVKNGHQNQVLSLAFSPKGDLLASGGSDNTAKVWDLAGKAPDDTVKSLPHPNLVDGVAFDKTGTLLATACHDGILRIWDVAKGTVVKTINAHTTPQPSPIYTVAWSPDAKQVATGSFDKTIKIWDAAGTLVRDIRPGADRLPPSAAAMLAAPAVLGSPGGGWLNAPPAPGHRDQVFTLAYSPDGKYLASGSSDRTVKLWDPAAGRLVRDFPNPTLKAPPAGQPHPSHPGFVHAVRFTKDGTKLVSAGTAPRGQGYLAVWAVADGKLLAAYELPVGPVYALDLTPAGVLLGCGPKARSQSEAEAVVLPLPLK